MTRKILKSVFKALQAGTYICNIGAKEGGCAADQNEKRWETENLYVSDGRAFPAIGLNPMITIQATAAYCILKKMA